MSSGVSARADLVELGRKQMKRTAKLLREARESAGLTQAQVAIAAGVSCSQVSLWELGHRWPQLDQLHAYGLDGGEGMEALRRAIALDITEQALAKRGLTLAQGRSALMHSDEEE